MSQTTKILLGVGIALTTLLGLLVLAVGSFFLLAPSAPPPMVAASDPPVDRPEPRLVRGESELRSHDVVLVPDQPAPRYADGHPNFRYTDDPDWPATAVVASSSYSRIGFTAVLIVPILLLVLGFIIIRAVMRSRTRPQVYYHAADADAPPPLPRRPARFPAFLAVGLGCGGALLLVVLLFFGLFFNISMRDSYQESVTFESDRYGTMHVEGSRKIARPTTTSTAAPQLNPVPVTTRLPPIVMPDAPADWWHFIPFQDARSYSEHESLAAAAEDLARLIAPAIQEEASMQQVVVRAMPGDRAAEPFVDALRRRVTHNTRLLDRAEPTPADAVELRLHHGGPAWSQTQPWGERRVGTLEVIREDRALTQVRYDTRPWIVHVPPRYVSGVGAAGRSPMDARRNAIVSAAWALVPHLRQHLSHDRDLADEVLHGRIIRAIQSGQWKPADEFEQHIQLQHGHYHIRHAVLLNAYPTELLELARVIDATGTIHSWAHLLGSLAGLLLVVLALYVGLNAITRGYFHTRLKVAAGIVVVGAVVGLLVLM